MRREADAAREAEDTEHATRREELVRWAEQDRAAEDAAGHERDDALVAGR